MDADQLPIVKEVTNRLRNLVKEGESLIDDNHKDEDSMPGPEILTELELCVTKDENIPSTQQPVVETSARDILYLLLVCSTFVCT